MPEIATASRPKLTLGLARVPLKLEVYRAKIGFLPAVTVAEPDLQSVITPAAARTVSVPGAHTQNPPPTIALDDHAQKLPAIAPADAVAPETIAHPPAKKHRKHPHASDLPWPPRSRLFPAIEFEGEPVPSEATQTYATPKAAELAARFWCRTIAWEVAARLPEDQRHDAEAFVLRHRLTVLNSFFRRLKKAAVVEAISKLFLSQNNISHDPGHVSEIN
jgi:hypothetical protein